MMQRYTLAVLALWIVNPELRRLHDWIFGYSQVEILSILPLLSLLPHVWSLSIGGGWRRLPSALCIVAWLWIGGFSYALLLAVLNSNVFSGVYAFLNFVLPIGLGLWIAADTTPLSVSRARVVALLFGLTSVLSIYGIIQYAFLPPWDALWLQNVSAQGSLSFGKPLPYQVRVFSMLNSPGPFGCYMACMLLMSLPHLSLRRPLSLAQMPFWLIAFGLSLDRSGWAMFAIGLVVYTVFSSQRATLVTTIASAVVLFFGLSTILPRVLNNDAITTTISDRLGTFDSLEHDDSAEGRLSLTTSAMQQFTEAPLGRGLGITGTATTLGDAGRTTDFDNGFFARLIEMGIPGAALYGATLCAMFAMLLRLHGAAKKRGDAALQSMIATAMAVEVGLVGLLASGEVTGLPLLLLWLFVCMVTCDRAFFSVA